MVFALDQRRRRGRCLERDDEVALIRPGRNKGNGIRPIRRGIQNEVGQRPPFGGRRIIHLGEELVADRRGGGADNLHASIQAPETESRAIVAHEAGVIQRRLPGLNGRVLLVNKVIDRNRHALHRRVAGIDSGRIGHLANADGRAADLKFARPCIGRLGGLRCENQTSRQAS